MYPYSPYVGEVNTTITYNGINPFANIAPTPFVTRTESFVQVGERLVMQETFTLRGNITGLCEFNGGVPYKQFKELVSDSTSPQLQLFKNFSKDFQTLQILDNTTPLLTRTLVQVTDISFPNNNYGAMHSFLPFEITLQCYPPQAGGRTFESPGSGPWNVLQPVHEITYDTQDDGTISISEVCSAQGLNTSNAGNNALTNAETWVAFYIGSHPTLPGVSLYGDTTSNSCLRSQTETINRFAATYEVRRTYVADPLDTIAGGILRYSVAYSYSEADGITTIELNGSIEGCRTDNMESDLTSARAKYASFQPLQKAIQAKVKFTNNPTLNPYEISKAVTEDSTKRRITFSFAYNDDMRPNPSFDYRCTFDYDYENDVVTASIEGECSSRKLVNQYASGDDAPSNNPKWLELSTFADKINLGAQVKADYSTYLQSIGLDYGSYPLMPFPNSTSRTNNYLEWRINLSANFRSQPLMLPPKFRKFDMTINVTPSLNQYREFPCLDGHGAYQIFDLKSPTRAQMSISANGVMDDTSDGVLVGLPAVKSQIQSFQSQNFTGNRLNMEGQQYSTNTSNLFKTVSANANYTAEGIVFTV